MAAKARPITVKTPLAPDALLFRRMAGREELGRLFEIEVDLLGPKNIGPHADALSDVAFAKMVGQPMTVTIETDGGGTRYINGIVSRFAYTGGTDRHAGYRATLRPWLWLLTRRSDCRIFQQKTVPEIVKEVFREHGLTDFSESLSGSYRKWDYKVQYRETDFDFVSRLLEQEGIYYWFKHEESKHTLVLSDSHSAHAAIPGYDEVPFYPPSDLGRRDRDHVDTWEVCEELKPGAYLLQDFDELKPKANLQAKLTSQHTLAKAKLEYYDYPGGYVVRPDGETYVKVRLEEIYARQAVASGAGTARGLFPGGLFKLTNFPRADQNKEYLVVSATYEANDDAYASGAGGAAGAAAKDPVFRSSFTAVEGSRPFRPARITPRPTIQGPQTAIVVGKSGEEIWTDENGRVKLQFHWDRLGKSDEASSCWVRVAQLWAGNKWGSLYIPRIGQEVVVEFMEGDPDRPLVTGRLYNGDMKTPYTLPSMQTQSGIKSRSSKGGAESNFNELRFEDKKGSEQIFIQAEKDLEFAVKNDETIKVTKNQTIEIGEMRKLTVKKDETVTIEGARTETVKKDETVTIEGGRTETVKKDEKVTVEGKRTVEIKKDESLKIAGKLSAEVTGDATWKFDGKRGAEVGGDDKLKVTGKLVIEASEITLKAGSASITIKQSGEIALKGVKVALDGSGQVQVKSSGAVDIQGSAIANK